MNKLISPLLGLLLMANVAYADEVKPEIIIKAAQAHGVVGAQQEPWNKLKEVIEEKSGGRIYVEMYPGAVLGSCNELAEKAMMGVIHMGSGSSSNLTTVNPKLVALEIPYLLTDMNDHMKLFYQGEGGRIGGALFDELNQPMLDKGIRFMGFEPVQYRDMGVNFSGLKHPEQLKGRKIRITTSIIERDCIVAMDATPVTIAVGELYTSLQQGTIDGEGLPVDLMHDMKHHEVIKSVARIHYNAFISTMFVNEAWYQGLPDWAREIIDEAFYEAALHGSKVFKELEIARVQDMIDAGVEIYEPDDAQMEEWEKILLPVREKYRIEAGKEWVDRLEAQLKS